MKSDPDIEIQAPWKALSDPIRRKIVELLYDKALTASELSEFLNTTNANISQHLKVLVQGQIAISHQKGNYRIYTLNPIGLENATNWLINHTPTKLKPGLQLKNKLDRLE